ncbi:hypothetical protein J6590_041171 [Homalodisca vitripennis]|nr:hypothetical protein J6590_041171 [Homalodisca vitripennis]
MVEQKEVWKQTEGVLLKRLSDFYKNNALNKASLSHQELKEKIEASKPAYNIINLNTGEPLFSVNTGKHYNYGFDGTRFVELSHSNKRYSVETSVIPANNIILVSEETEIMNQLMLYNSVENVNINKNTDIELELVQGVPGCGKTTFIINKYTKGDLVLFPTRECATDFRNRLKQKDQTARYNDIKDSCRTIHSFIINSTNHIKSGGKYNRLIIDEALMLHAANGTAFVSDPEGVRQTLPKKNCANHFKTWNPRESDKPCQKNCEAHLTTATLRESDKPCPKNCEKHLTPVTVRESDKPCLKNCDTFLNTDHTKRTHSSHCHLIHQQSRNSPMSSPEQGPNIIKVQPEIHRYIDGTEPELPKNQGLPALKLKREINPPAKDLDVIDSFYTPKVNTPSNTSSACTIKNPTGAKTTHGTSPAKNCHKEKTNLEIQNKNLHKQKQVEENITLLHENIRKLENKRERLNHLLSEVSPTILRQTLTTPLSLNTGSSLVSADHHYGGVVLYLKDDTEVEEIPINIKKPQSRNGL